MTRLLLVDDHVMVRQALGRTLGDVPEFEVVGQAGSGEECLELIPRLSPEVVLMDIGMPGMGGLATTEKIRRDYPQVNVLILTIHNRDDYFFKSFQAGASGYILKDAEMEELVAAVQEVAQGKTYIFPTLIPKLIDDYLQRVRGDRSPGARQALSEREKEVLRLIAAGTTTNEIASTLNISTHTVRRHRDHIMAKLDLHSAAQLIRFAIDHGLLNGPA